MTVATETVDLMPIGDGDGQIGDEAPGFFTISLETETEV